MVMKTVIGVVVGAALGYGWYRLVGCSTGACPLTSNPYSSSLYGALMGWLIAAS